MKLLNDIKRPLISVVVPAYNAERTVGEAIHSVLDGTFEDLEVVVCDDASTDDTVGVVETISDSRVRLIRNETNAGEGASRDGAIAAATGQWITMLDADDAFTPERLTVLMGAARDHPDAIIFDELMECHDTSRGLRPWRTVRSPTAYPGDPGVARYVSFNDWMRNPSQVMQPLIPTKLIREHKITHSNAITGADIGFRCALLAKSRTKLWYVPRPMYLYRKTPGSITTSSNRHSVLARELERVLPMFQSQPDKVASLQYQIRQCWRNAQYQAFFSRLAVGDITGATREAMQRPWVIPEFVRRAALQVPYHVSRIWCGGRRKRTA